MTLHDVAVCVDDIRWDVPGVIGTFLAADRRYNIYAWTYSTWMQVMERPLPIHSRQETRVQDRRSSRVVALGGWGNKWRWGRGGTCSAA